MVRVFYPIDIDAILLKKNCIYFANQYSHFCLLESNDYPNYPYSTFGSFIAIDSIAIFNESKDILNNFDTFISNYNDWVFGYASYDLKNKIETDLTSNNNNIIEEDIIHFFVPKYLIKIENNTVFIGVNSKKHLEECTILLNKIINYKAILDTKKNTKNTNIQCNISKENYINTIQKIQQQIVRGNIYETNFCIQFLAQNYTTNAALVFEKLNKNAKAPFSSFLKINDIYVLCSSPERFLKKIKDKLISQPIKGTLKNKFLQNNELINFENNQKERSENIMIVDLVRNDLAKIATKNSVKVEELCKIYTFKHVHQMISTITGNINNNTKISAILNATFPMGSMTGAPKRNAMLLMEEHETFKRGIYSGAVGYITPKQNFDFNVVIRSIIYNASKQTISIPVGSAITIESNPEKEYEECLLKANAMLDALNF